MRYLLYILVNIESKVPDLVDSEVIGKSFLGKNIIVLKITNENIDQCGSSRPGSGYQTCLLKINTKRTRSPVCRS